MKSSRYDALTKLNDTIKAKTPNQMKKYMQTFHKNDLLFNPETDIPEEDLEDDEDDNKKSKKR